MKSCLWHRATLTSLVLATLAGGAFATTTTPAAADGSPEHPYVITVSATRTLKHIEEVPASVSVITAKEIEARHADTLAEVLQYIPGVFLNQAAEGGLQVRGFDSTDVLVLVDGVPMHSTYDNKVNWNMIPVANIERVEVARGAGSSLYGGHAVGAVINVYTKTGALAQDDYGQNPDPDALAPTKKLFGDASVSIGSHRSRDYVANLAIKPTDNTRLSVFYEKKSTDGFPGYYVTQSATTKPPKGSTPIAASGDVPTLENGKYVLGGRGSKKLTLDGLSIGFQYAPKKSQLWSYSYEHAKTTYSYHHPFSYVYANGEPVFNGAVKLPNGKYLNLRPNSLLGYKGLRERNVHQLTFRDDVHHLEGFIAYNDMAKNGYSQPENPKSIHHDGEGAYSFHPGRSIHFDIHKAWKLGKNHNLLTGISYQREQFDQKRYYLTHWRDLNSIDTSKGHHGIYGLSGGKAMNAAFYLQDEWRVNRDVFLYLGARADYYKKYDGYGVDYNPTTGATTRNEHYGSGHYTEISPKISVQYYLNDDMSVYASYGHSFNPPALYQVYRNAAYNAMGGSVIANPDLAPERSDTLEVGWKYNTNEYRTQWGLSLYQVKTHDRIAYATHYDPANPGKALYKNYMNAGEETRKGIELSVNHQFNDQWTGYANYAWQKGHLRQNAVTNTNLVDVSSADYSIPRHIFHAGVLYNQGPWTGTLDMQYVSARQAPNSVTGEYGSEDPYFLVNTALTYRFLKGWEAQFAVYNLFDRHFFANEAADGRNYTLTVRYAF